MGPERWYRNVVIRGLLTGVAGVVLAAHAAAAAEKEPAPPTKEAVSPRAKPGLQGVASPDLAVVLRAPDKATTGRPLGTVRAEVRNVGKGASETHRVELTLQPFGTHERGKTLATRSGKPLRAGDRQVHGLAARAPAEGRYLLCARVETRGDAVPGNDESCHELLVVAAPAEIERARRLGRSSEPEPAAADARPTTTMMATTSLATRQAKVQRLVRMRSDALSRAQSILEEMAYRGSHHGTDCDDSRADVHPGASETCDLVDNDCDGEVDEGQTFLAYADADGDGHGDPNTAVDVCPSQFREAQEDGEWLSTTGNDCDDSDPDRWHDCE